MPSSTGVISSITAADGNTYAFALGSDNHVYYSEKGPWVQLGDYYPGMSFSQLSAGLDTNGQPICYAIQNNSAYGGWPGQLWKFNIRQQFFGSLFTGESHYNVPWPEGGVCLQISATRHGECYAIGTDRSVYLNDTNGNWSWVAQPSDGAVQISAGVDQLHQDEVYVRDPSGYVEQVFRDGSWGWLYSAQIGYLKANQISAGVGDNMTGTDLYYLDQGNRLHQFDGNTDTPLGFWGTQISAGLDASDNSICYGIGYNHALYTVSGPCSVVCDGGWMTQISGAQQGMAFVIGTNNQIWAWHSSFAWGSYWSAYGYSTPGWYWWGGVSANPNA
jgi:hypothetical protein